MCSSDLLQPLSVARDDAVAVGLIANEFMTNSFKHAFPAGKSGEIGIALGRDERGRVRVVLTDDGVGRKGTHGTGGSGVDLIASLATQVRARVDWDGGQGTRLAILLPMSIPSALGRRV